MAVRNPKTSSKVVTFKDKLYVLPKINYDFKIIDYGISQIKIGDIIVCKDRPIDFLESMNSWFCGRSPVLPPLLLKQVCNMLDEKYDFYSTGNKKYKASLLRDDLLEVLFFELKK